MLLGFIIDSFGLDKDTIKPYLEWLGINVSDLKVKKRLTGTLRQAI